MRSCAVGVSLPFHSWLQIACMADGVLRVPCLLGGGTSSHRDSVSKGGWSMLIALPSMSASGGSIPLYGVNHVWASKCGVFPLELLLLSKAWPVRQPGVVAVFPSALLWYCAMVVCLAWLWFSVRALGGFA